MSVAVPFSLRIRLGLYEIEISGSKEDVLETVNDLPNLVAAVSEAFAQVGTDINVSNGPNQSSSATPSASAGGGFPSIQASGSCSEAVLRLLMTDWGRSAPRTLPELVEALRVNAVHYPVTTLSGVLHWLVRKGKVKRWKTDKGYVYVLSGSSAMRGQVQAQAKLGGG